MQVFVAPPDPTPAALHPHEAETIFVQKGSMQVECGNDIWTGGVGSTFLLHTG